jgi:hypothetical protein
MADGWRGCQARTARVDPRGSVRGIGAGGNGSEAGRRRKEGNNCLLDRWRAEVDARQRAARVTGGGPSGPIGGPTTVRGLATAARGGTGARATSRIIVTGRRHKAPIFDSLTIRRLARPREDRRSSRSRVPLAVHSATCDRHRWPQASTDSRRERRASAACRRSETSSGVGRSAARRSRERAVPRVNATDEKGQCRGVSSEHWPREEQGWEEEAWSECDMERRFQPVSRSTTHASGPILERRATRASSMTTANADHRRHWVASVWR